MHSLYIYTLQHLHNAFGVLIIKFGFNVVKLHIGFSFQCYDTVGWATEGHPAWKKLNVSLLMVTFWLELAHLIAPVVTTTFLAPIKSRMETFWYRLTQVHLENGL